jgi:hypothetical protein
MISHDLANLVRLENHTAAWLSSGPEAVLQDQTMIDLQHLLLNEVPTLLGKK